MPRMGRRKRKKVRSSSSFEGNTSVLQEKDEEWDTESSAIMADNNNATETPSLMEIWKVLTQIKTNTEKLVVDVESLKGNYKELKETLQNTKGQVDTLVKENNGLKSRVKSLEEQLLESKKEVEELDERLNDIEAKHDDLEQYTRKFNLVIHGIPEQEEEDNVANVVTLGKILQVNLTPGDIDIVHRMNTKSKDKPRPIIARFSNYNAKSKLYKARFNLRKADLKVVGAEKVFINENLTAWRAELFKEARKLKKKYRNGKTWTIDGKIFLKTDITAKVVRIDSHEDLKGL